MGVIIRIILDNNFIYEERDVEGEEESEEVGGRQADGGPSLATEKHQAGQLRLRVGAAHPQPEQEADAAGGQVH